MLGLENPIHIAILLVLLLLVFGAKRLPELGRSRGGGLRGFKESISGEAPAGQIEAPANAAVEAHPAGIGRQPALDEITRQPLGRLNVHASTISSSSSSTGISSRRTSTAG